MPIDAALIANRPISSTQTSNMYSQKILTLAALLALSGCAWHQKLFVSSIQIDGINHGLVDGDEGSFYVDSHPLVRLEMTCHKETTLGISVSLGVPLPVWEDKHAHHSIAQQRFGLSLFNDSPRKSEFSAPSIGLRIGDSSHTLRLENSASQTDAAHYQYTSDIRCSALNDATMSITFGKEKIRVYRLQFKEGIQHRFTWTPGLAT